MSAKPIVVIGSTNTDMVIRTEKFPSPGETLLGGKFFLFPGGKGANQAVAASRLGGDVFFITKLGNDIFGKQAIEQFKKEGLHTDYVRREADLPSGVALITVNAKGENTIVVAQGANGTLTEQDISRDALSIGEIFLLQLEIPLATVGFVAREMTAQGKRVIINPAPAAELPSELLKGLYCITPNQTEAGALTGIAVNDAATAAKAASKLYSLGVSNVVITLGEAGAFLHNSETQKYLPGIKTDAVDTTAAGDVFCGALVVAIAEGMSMEQSILFANKAASISVTRMGAQTSAPYRNEIKP